MKNLKKLEIVSELVSETTVRLTHITKELDELTVNLTHTTELLNELMGKIKEQDELLDALTVKLTHLDMMLEGKKAIQTLNELMKKSQGPTVFRIAEEEISKIIKTDKHWFYRGYTFELKDGIPYDERFGGYLSDEDVVYIVEDEINKITAIYDDEEE